MKTEENKGKGGEEVTEMGGRQRRPDITGLPEEESQNSEMELLFRTMTKESFLEVKEGLNLLYLFHTREQ